MRKPAFLFLLLTLLSSPVTSLGAQEPEPLRFDILPVTGEATVEIIDLFSDASLVNAVLSGLPLRIRVRVQLWNDGFFDNQRGQYDWRASILFDPLTRRYRVQTSERTGAEIEVNTLEEARAALQLTLSIPLKPSEPGRYYYIAAVEMETLSLSDLEELQRWLQGDLAPVVAGGRDVEGALAKGFRRVLVRMLGLPAKRFQVQSPSFRVDFREGAGDPRGPGKPLPLLRPSYSTGER
ncbi:MAG: DUF4390 domain-containing protein [Longimicrobiales bacterium]|nr:DUF4390 domain-containing protein [Longimicrobiales bacterium]